MSWDLISIGVRRYNANETYNELPNASSDASSVAVCFGRFLPEGRRFTVTNLLDPSAAEAAKHIEAKLRRLDSNSILMIYFAGHAVETGGAQWLLFHDALPCFQRDIIGTGAISSDYFREIERRGQGRIFIVVDACRTPPFRGRGADAQQMRQDRFGEVCRTATHKRFEVSEEDEEVQADVIKLLSCQRGEMASDNGAFAQALIGTVLDRLKETDEVRIDDVFMTEMTRLLQERNPWQRPYFVTNCLEPFILVPKGKNSTKAPRAVVDRPQKADDTLNPETPKPPKTPERPMEQARAALETGRFDEAERLAKAALESDSHCSWAIEVRDEARRQRKEHEDEERRLREERAAKERRDRELDQILNEGWHSFRKGDVTTARRNVRIVLKERLRDELALALYELSYAAGIRRTLEINEAQYGFCWIPAGEFEMGSPRAERDRRDDETLHHVKLTKGFWLLETPVTQGFYESVMKTNPSKFKGADLPVETVSWNDAVAFCNELTKLLPQGGKAKLPTEAQWEYACRAGTRTAFSFGDQLNGDYANCYGKRPYGTNTEGAYLEKTTPVKNYGANPWNLFDMHGNVWEWTSDWYGGYPNGATIDPTGPQDGERRVCRGGGWDFSARHCRSAHRFSYEPDFRSKSLGFRVLLVCD